MRWVPRFSLMRQLKKIVKNDSFKVQISILICFCAIIPIPLGACYSYAIERKYIIEEIEVEILEQVWKSF